MKQMKNPLFYTHIDSPIGRLLLAGDEQALHYLSFPKGKMAFGPNSKWLKNDSPFKEVKRQIDSYFAKELTQFDLPLKMAGTDFQKKVWQTLPDITYGQTRSYGWLADRVGSPKASRAVGAANGNNPLPIIIPCHRVIGASGKMTGFGGGIDTKIFLLELEGVII